MSYKSFADKKDPTFEKWWEEQEKDSPDLAPGTYWGEVLKEFVWAGWRECLRNEKEKK